MATDFGGPIARLKDSAQHPDGSGLPRAIWPEEAEDRSFFDGKRNVINRRECAETLCQPFALNHRFRHRKRNLENTKPGKQTKDPFVFSCFPDSPSWIPGLPFHFTFGK